MRIALVSSLFIPPGIGGYVRHLGEALAARGHRVTVFTRGRFTGFSRQAFDGFRVVWVPFAPLPPFHLVLHEPFLNRAVSMEGPFEVVNVHSPLCPRVRTDEPMVTTVHTPLVSDIDHEEERDLRSRAGRLLARSISVPAERELLRRSTLILATSRGVAEDLAPHGISPAAVRVVGNGVDTNRFHPPPPESRAEAEILYVGRLGTRKGVQDLIAAFARVREGCPGAILRILGDGPRRSFLMAQTRALGLNGTVRFEGFVPSEEVEAAYRLATCVVVPSLYEGLSTVLLEAMASGAPVVATTVPGSEDVVEDDVNGRLVPPRNSKALARAIQAILASRSEAERFGRAARRTMETGFTWEAVASRYEEAFRTVVG